MNEKKRRDKKEIDILSINDDLRNINKWLLKFASLFLFCTVGLVIKVIIFNRKKSNYNEVPQAMNI